MKKLIPTLLLGIFVVSAANAQTADDIITKYINVMGGKDKLLSIKNVYMEGNMDLTGSDMNVKYWVVNKKAVRYEYTVNGPQVITSSGPIRDGYIIQ